MRLMMMFGRARRRAGLVEGKSVIDPGGGRCVAAKNERA